LRTFEGEGLVYAAGPAFALTPAGEQALAAARPARERRRFTFVGVPGGEPHFLPWTAAAGPPAPGGAADARWLAACVERPATWKEQFGFPTDVIGVELPVDGAGPEAWRRVVVAHAERVPVALAVVEPGRLVGFVVRGDDLDPNAPAVSLDAGWEGPFPELAREPDVRAP
jgi:hypothetical protein